MLPWMRRTECAPFPWRASLQSGVLETRGCMQSSSRAWSAVPCRWRHRRARSRRKLRAGWRERMAAQTEMCPNTHTHTHTLYASTTGHTVHTTHHAGWSSLPGDCCSSVECSSVVCSFCAIIAALPPRPQDGTACFSHRTLHHSVRLCDRL